MLEAGAAVCLPPRLNHPAQAGVRWNHPAQAGVRRCLQHLPRKTGASAELFVQVGRCCHHGDRSDSCSSLSAASLDARERLPACWAGELTCPVLARTCWAGEQTAPKP